MCEQGGLAKGMVGMSRYQSMGRKELIAELERLKRGDGLSRVGGDRADEHRQTNPELAKGENEALFKSEALLNEVGRIAKIGGWEHDLVTRKASWTAETYRIVEIDPEEDPPGPDEYLSYFPEGDREILAEAMARTIETGESFDLELRCNTSGGRMFWSRAMGTPVFSEGRCVKVRGVFQDITERKEVAEALKEREERFRQLAENIKGVFWLVSPDWSKVEYVSPSYQEVWGRSTESLMRSPMSWLDALPEEDRKRIWACIEEIRATGSWESVFPEYRVIRPDNTVRWVSAKSFPVTDNQGEVVRIAGMCEDITEKKEVERDYRNLFNAMAGGFALHEVICNEQGTPIDYRFIDVNPAFERLTGLRREQIVGKTVQEVLPGVESVWIEKYGNVALTGKPVEFDSHSGELDRHYKVSAYSPVRGQFATVFSDVTKDKKYEKELRKAMGEADVANRAKNEFLATMSHEIRTPLNGVLGMLQLLQTTSLAEEQREFVVTAMKSAKSLTRLLADILDLSKIESGKLDILQEKFRLDEMRESVLELFEAQARNKGLPLSFDMAPDVPVELVGDGVRLRQILFNLTGNAIKFTEKGKVSVEVNRLPWHGNDRMRLLFTVTDTGVGIPEEKLKRIIEPFTQADSSHTRRFGGTGLGLTIVRRLAGLMGGELSLMSENGRGTQVCLSLPFTLPGQGGPQEEKAESVALSGTIRVLCAEDEHSNRFMVKRALEKKGCVVTCVSDGKQALDILEDQDFDLVLMDVQMPVMDGLEAVKQIRTSSRFKTKAHIPVIALTAFAMAGDRERMIEAGMDEYLAKPLILDDLMAAVRRITSRSDAP